MIHALSENYFKLLKENFKNREEQLRDVAEGREQRALLYGVGRPIYLTEVSPLRHKQAPSTNLIEFQKNLTVFAVNPPKYEYDFDIMEVTEKAKKLYVTINDSMQGTVTVNGISKDIKKGTKFLLEKDTSHIINITDENGNNYYPLQFTKDSKQSLLDLLDVLVDTIDSPDFYGLTSVIDDRILHISHPMVLQNLLENIDDPEERIFDSTWLYKYRDPIETNPKILGPLQLQYANISSILEASNSKGYIFSADIQDRHINIKETYNGSQKFTAIIPIQTAYSAHISFPYYGIEQVTINSGKPVGVPFWPLTSPNIDTYAHWEVCTGTKLPTLEGVSMLFDGNFASTFATSSNEGTFRHGYIEAIAVMIDHTKKILNTELEESLTTLEEPSLLNSFALEVSGRLSTVNIKNWVRLVDFVKDNTVPIEDVPVNISDCREYILNVKQHGGIDSESLRNDVEKGVWLANEIVKLSPTVTEDDLPSNVLEFGSPHPIALATWQEFYEAQTEDVYDIDIDKWDNVLNQLGIMSSHGDLYNFVKYTLDNQ